MPPSDLDFGVMCGGTEFDDWKAECIRKLRDVEQVNLELLIVDDTESIRSGGLTGKFKTVLEYRDKTSTGDAINEVTWYLYRKPFDKPPCKTKTDLSDELDSVERVNCEVQEDGFSQYFHEDDVNKLREYNLDFVLRFAFGIIRGDILDVPKYGIWSFHHDDERKYRGGPACFWEIYNGDPVTGAILQRLTDRLDGGIVLKRGFFSTNNISYKMNLNNVYYGTTEWPAQVAIDILNGNGDYVDRSPTKSDAPIYRSPSPYQISLYNLKRAYSLGTTALRGISDWSIGVLQMPIHESIDEPLDAEINWFPRSKKDGYLADPFPITIEDTTYIFVENFSYSDRKGKISYIEYPSGFESGDFRIAHEEPFHMSYPYLFEHDGDIYATPEVYESNEVKLYRVISPSDWEVKTTLVHDTDAVDPTVIEYDGRWWMFYTEQRYDNTKLFVQYSDELTGDWVPHKNNPVKTDVRSSRPGGTPFVENNKLYRPAQDCAGGYGKQIVINQVDKLTPTQYAEKKISEHKPTKASPYPAGMHTLSSQGNITLVDGKRRVWNKYALQRRSKQGSSKILP